MDASSNKASISSKSEMLRRIWVNCYKIVKQCRSQIFNLFSLAKPGQRHPTQIAPSAKLKFPAKKGQSRLQHPRSSDNVRIYYPPKCFWSPAALKKRINHGPTYYSEVALMSLVSPSASIHSQYTRSFNVALPAGVAPKVLPGMGGGNCSCHEPKLLR